jgi:hypothetical protein
MFSKLLCVLGVLLIAAVAWAQVPNFDYPYFLSNPSGYIVAGNVYDIPEMGDWDADGSIDMLVGVFFNGNIQYYHNSAPAGQTPVFGAFSLLQADGADISVTYG